jgi:hypothetical protein
MDIGTINTETPHYIIVKEYETAPKMEDLTEIFIVIYVVDLPNWKRQGGEEQILKDSMRYLFFTDLERAFKQYKYFGPKGAYLQRAFTDNDELIELAEQSNFTINEEEETEEKKEEVVKEEKSIDLK